MMYLEQFLSNSDSWSCNNIELFSIVFVFEVALDIIVFELHKTKLNIPALFFWKCQCAYNNNLKKKTAGKLNVITWLLDMQTRV